MCSLTDCCTTLVLTVAVQELQPSSHGLVVMALQQALAQASALAPRLLSLYCKGVWSNRISLACPLA